MLLTHKNNKDREGDGDGEKGKSKGDGDKIFKVYSKKLNKKDNLLNKLEISVVDEKAE